MKLTEEDKAVIGRAFMSDREGLDALSCAMKMAAMRIANEAVRLDGISRKPRVAKERRDAARNVSHGLNMALTMLYESLSMVVVANVADEDKRERR